MAATQSDELTDFERDTLDTLRIEGDVEYRSKGERSLCELFGLPNCHREELHRALRQLAKMGLIVQLDGTRNAMDVKRTKLRHDKKTSVYRAVT